MELDEYQEKAMTTCMESCDNFSYMMLNLVGEVGEFSSKVAKQIRKENVAIGKHQDNVLAINVDSDADFLEIKQELVLEAGDILWQIAGLCKVMGWSLEEVARMNLYKLHQRQIAGTIDGSGDGIIRSK